MLTKEVLHSRLFFLSILIFGSLICATQKAWAQEDNPLQAFTENKGQWHNNIKYRYDTKYQQVFLENNAFRFNLIDFESHDELLSHPPKISHLKYIKAHAYLMQFEGANPLSETKGEAMLKHYNNYFIGKDESHWAKNVKSYKTVRYDEIYPKTDLQVYFCPKGLKYDIIVKKGGDYQNIKIQYKGVSSLRIKKNGSLVVKTSVGKIIEEAPIVYQIIEGEKHFIKTRYQLNKQSLTFQMDSTPNPNYDLIIDPTLVFSTYSGATSDNWGFTATYDKEGNVYQGGIIFNTGYPSTLGAYQYNFAGGEVISPTRLGCDMVFSKYTPDGTDLLWATYLGGELSEEIPHSLVVDEMNNLLIMGTTGSIDYPTTSGAYDNSFNGGTSTNYMGGIKFSNGTDIVVSKLHENGNQLLASTFIGGTANDGLNWQIGYNTFAGNHKLYNNYGDGARGEIICNKQSEVLVGSTTFSSNFPTVNAFQSSFGGLQDGIVFKLSPNLNNLIWSSYLGGSQGDAIFSLDLDSEGETYVCGGTLSPNFPVSSDAYKTNISSDSTEAFVSHISSDGSTLLHSSFFGSNYYDQAYFVRLNRYNDVYIMGQTYAHGSTLIYNASYGQAGSGQFIAKFSSSLQSLIWSTVFGTGNNRPNISPTAFAVDYCDQIYLSGWGREFVGYNGPSSFTGTFGTKGMEITSDALQDTTDGQDYYIMQMDGNASQLLYATFFGEIHYGEGNACGQDHVDGGTSRFDRKGNIYQASCSSCGNASPDNSCNAFPTTPGSFSPNTGALVSSQLACNNTVSKISFATNLVIADFESVTNGCQTDTIAFQSTGSGTYFYWDFDDNGATSTEANPEHQFPLPGFYNVQLVVVDSNSCNISDTIVKTIGIAMIRTNFLDTVFTCFNDSIQIGLDPVEGHSYEWFPTTGLSNSTISNPLALPPNSGYYVLLDQNFCRDSVFQYIKIRGEDHILSVSNDTMICANQSILLEASTNIPVDSIIWSKQSDFSELLNPDLSPSITVIPTEAENVYYVMSIEDSCQVRHIDSVIVKVDLFDIEITGETDFCFGDSSVLTASISTENNFTLTWAPASAFSTPSDQNPAVFIGPNSTTVTVTVNDELGCTAQHSFPFQVHPFHVSVNQINNLCYGDCIGELSVIVNGTPPYSYLWSNNSTQSQIEELCSGTYHVTVSDHWSCSDTLSLLVSNPSELIADYTVTPTGCNADTAIGSIIGTISGGVPPYHFEWSNGSHEQNIENLTYGDYSLTITDSHNCEKTLDFSVNDLSNFEVAFNISNVKCNGGCTGRISPIFLGEQHPPYTYQWSNGSTNSYIDSLCVGVYKLRLIDAQGCVRYVGASIQQPPKLVLLIHPTPQICNGDPSLVGTEVIGGTPEYQYLWDNGSTEASAALFDGMHQVIVEDANGCKDTVHFQLKSPEPIIHSFETGQAICPTSCTGTLLVNSSGGVGPHHYYLDNHMLDSCYTDSICPGEHFLTIIDHLGCTHKMSITIPSGTVYLPLSINATPLNPYPGESIQLEATYYPNSIYHWQPDQLIIGEKHIYNPKAKSSKDIHFEVLMIDSLQCEHKASLRIGLREIICDEPYIDIPNAFSPNDDLVNDKYRVRGKLIENIEMNIYNRWGELVHQINQINESWDGTFKGKKVDPGVFVYQLQITCIGDKKLIKSGNITVIH